MQLLSSEQTVTDSNKIWTMTWRMGIYTWNPMMCSGEHLIIVQLEVDLRCLDGKLLFQILSYFIILNYSQ